uniref:Type-4 uracil-DNA glycosylase n=1 Tax=uncultured Armatimonadetes bacterium TaxID=157466 RepID=A0A6J4I309_9BACT|nr:Uracil-DNA glycosylase, family 4 [uncultured Armatimonadetes bacterium]
MAEAGDKEQQVADLAERASVCVACDLHESRTNVVFGEGNPNSPLVLVGEGPGETEDRTGRPFVGRAGKLLDECLRECGILRKHVFVTNVVRCRPTLEEGGRLKNRPPRTDEANTCISLWLEPTLTVIDPLVILCLGAPAANTIIKKGFKMMQERGQFFESKYARYAIAALHPAYILRQQGEAYDEARASLVQDIEAARKKVIEAKKEPPRTLF